MLPKNEETSAFSPCMIVFCATLVYLQGVGSLRQRIWCLLVSLSGAFPAILQMKLSYTSGSTYNAGKTVGCYLFFTWWGKMVKKKRKSVQTCWPKSIPILVWIQGRSCLAVTQPAIMWRISRIAMPVWWRFPDWNTILFLLVLLFFFWIFVYLLLLLPDCIFFAALSCAWSKCTFVWISLSEMQSSFAPAGNQDTKSACFNSCFAWCYAARKPCTLTTKEEAQSITLSSGLLQEHNSSPIWCLLLFLHFFLLFLIHLIEEPNRYRHGCVCVFFFCFFLMIWGKKIQPMETAAHFRLLPIWNTWFVEAEPLGTSSVA